MSICSSTKGCLVKFPGYLRFPWTIFFVTQVPSLPLLQRSIRPAWQQCFKTTVHCYRHLSSWHILYIGILWNMYLIYMCMWLYVYTIYYMCSWYVQLRVCKQYIFKHLYPPTPAAQGGSREGMGLENLGQPKIGKLKIIGVILFVIFLVILFAISILVCHFVCRFSPLVLFFQFWSVVLHAIFWSFVWLFQFWCVILFVMFFPCLFLFVIEI